MIATGISADPIYKRFLWLKWLEGYNIRVAFPRKGMIRLQRRQSGKTKKGSYYAWRTSSTHVYNKDAATFTKMCRRHARTSYDIKWSLYGINDIRAQSYNSKASPKYLYSEIITLDFGKR